MSARDLRYRAELGAFRVAQGVLRALPHAAARALGARLGAVACRLDRRHRTIALDNIARALPELDGGGRRRLVRRCFAHFGGMACDLISSARFGPEALCRRLALSGWRHLVEADGHGKGTFLMTAHLGHFELLALPVALYRGAVSFIVRPPDNPLLRSPLRALRERFGGRIIPRRGAARSTLRALTAGERVFILVDQRVRPHEGVEVPFFGRPAVTSTFPARLSLRCGSPVVPIFCYPRPRGCYLVEVLPAIHPAGDGPDAVAELTRAYVEVTEAEIRKHPEMWLWMHDRWRQRR